ncbi:Thioredoxin-like protein [Actinidia chinensis var. chinensis]|uniref:Thioredoxin-like protein n=1 Tax=Actinidia chinensis var. chinensis TaxID=1590841 RepID=A0A2R6QKJ6_ACTCC|nr:Thioredoxin-like protein [Actinidia chinensis var. chinensis]
MLSVPSIFSSCAPPPQPLCLSNFPFKTHHPNLLFPTTTTSRPSLLSAPISPPLPRKLLCRTPSAKYVREDYLVKKLSAKEVQELVKGERNVPLIIDFYATWCGPCILMAQELEMLAVEYESSALIVKVDTDDEYEFARDMQVRGLPTLYFISPDPNKDAIRTEGLIPIQMMRDIIDNQM